MANKISIVIGVKNRASRPIRQVRKDVRALRGNLKSFNRDLFATTALVGTFTMAFRKALQIGKLGAQFEYVNKQFTSMFGADGSYFKSLQFATRHTADAMTLMEEAVTGYASGLDKEEIRMAFGISVAAAKATGTSTEAAMKKVMTSLKMGRSGFLAMFSANIKWNNAFKNQMKMIGETTKGWGAANLQGSAYRKAVLHAGYIASLKLLDVQEDSLEILMRTGASFRSLQQIVGQFITRAMAPLSKTIAMINEKAFMKLNAFMATTGVEAENLRGGIVDLIKTVGGALATLTAFWGSFKILGLFLSTVGVSMGAFAGVATLFALAMAGARGENESWLQLLSRIGTEFKIYFEAFTSYKDGIVTLSGETAARFAAMDEDVRNRIWFMVKVLAVVKESLLGFGQGFMFVFDTIKKGLTWFGIWDEKTKQLSTTWAGLAKWVGKVVGAFAAFKLLKMGLSVALGGAGGLLGFKRGSSPLTPMYTSEVGLGVMGGGGFVGRLGAAITSGFSKGRVAAFGLRGGQMMGNTVAGTIGHIFAQKFGRIAKALIAPFSFAGRAAAGAVKGIGFAVQAVIPFLPIILAGLFLALAGYAVWKRIVQPWKEGGLMNIGGSGDTGVVKDSTSGARASGLGMIRKATYDADVSADRITAFKNKVGQAQMGNTIIDLSVLEKITSDHHVTSQELLDFKKANEYKEVLNSTKGSHQWSGGKLGMVY